MNKTLKTAVVVGLAGVTGAVLSPLGIAGAGHTNPVLVGNLKGSSEVSPGGPTGAVVGDPDGKGKVFVFGVDGDPTTLCYVLMVEGIGQASAAHIHEGGRRENGDVVANLAAPGDGNAADCLTEGEEGKFPTGESVQDILSNPGDYYVNVHNAEFPGGAIRGQLRPQGGDPMDLT